MSERKVHIGDTSSLDIELAVAQADKEGILKGKQVVEVESHLLVLWFALLPLPKPVSFFPISNT